MKLVHDALGGHARKLVQLAGLDKQITFRLSENILADSLTVWLSCHDGTRHKLHVRRMDIDHDAFGSNDWSNITLNLGEFVLSFAASLLTPKDGGRFTQEDAFKLMGCA